MTSYKEAKRWVLRARLKAGTLFEFLVRVGREFHSQYLLKAIGDSGHFRYRFFFKVHRFTNNLQGLQKVMVKDFS